MAVNPETAAAMVALLQDGRDEPYVAQQYHISNSTVHRIFTRFLETGAYTRRPGTGPQRRTNAHDDRFIILQSLRNRRATAVEIRNRLHHVRNTNVSERTVRRRLGEANLTSRRPATGPELLRRHRIARLQFARNHEHWGENEWGRVLFTDESRFSLRSPDGRERVWRRQQERFTECAFSPRVGYQGGSVMVWAGISLEAHTELYIVPRGSLTAARYIDEILQDLVVPYVDFIGDDFLLMHDNARPHTARITQQYLNDVNIPVMEWPALSLDANPIEHVWDMLGRRIRTRVPAPLTLNQLQQALLEEWELIPQEDIRHLILGMPRRIHALIRARGGNTRY